MSADARVASARDEATLDRLAELLAAMLLDDLRRWPTAAELPVEDEPEQP
jgi:hypothetical protein